MRSMLGRRTVGKLLGGMALAPILGPRRAVAQKADDTLRITWRDAVPDVDFYYNAQRTGFLLQLHVWDGLIYRDPDTLQLRPLLATAWKQVDPTTIDFALRPGVAFHNGDPLTADDVVYTISTVIADPRIAVPSNYVFLAGAEKLDELKVRVTLKRVFPAALEYIAMVLPIWPRAYRERLGAAAYALAPVGTGPYRVTRVDDMSAIVLQRNDGYFAGSPKGRPRIGRIAITEVADAAAELDALLRGHADWIWDFTPDMFNTVASAPGLQAVVAETMRVAYIDMDSAGRSGPDNPLTRPQVRQAVAMAIDRNAMVRQFMLDAGRVLDAPCYPTQFGCDESSATHYEYNPAKARQLLADAGYPSGFATELVSYLLPQWAVAVQGYLKAVGIDAHVAQLPVADAIRRNAEGESPLSMGSWGSYSINDVSAFLPYFFTGGPNDYTRDPKIEALVREGGSVTDLDQRRRAYSQAIKLITAPANFLPLFTYAKTYGFSRDLAFRPSPDELPRFYLSAWQ
jgi:peptide/nickel transport system substrate-binding protein